MRTIAQRAGREIRQTAIAGAICLAIVVAGIAFLAGAAVAAARVALTRRRHRRRK